jgi:hypothetical protein
MLTCAGDAATYSCSASLCHGIVSETRWGKQDKPVARLSVARDSISSPAPLMLNSNYQKRTNFDTAGRTRDVRSRTDAPWS